MSETPQVAPTVYDHLTLMLDQMVSVAWQKIGLHPDMVTGKIEPNLSDARVAIDVAQYLVSCLETQVDDEDKRQLQSIIRDLKINFVQQQGGNQLFILKVRLGDGPLRFLTNSEFRTEVEVLVIRMHKLCPLLSKG